MEEAREVVDKHSCDDTTQPQKAGRSEWAVEDDDDFTLNTPVGKSSAHLSDLHDAMVAKGDGDQLAPVDLSKEQEEEEPDTEDNSSNKKIDEETRRNYRYILERFAVFLFTHGADDKDSNEDSKDPKDDNHHPKVPNDKEDKKKCQFRKHLHPSLITAFTAVQSQKKKPKQQNTAMRVAARQMLSKASPRFHPIMISTMPSDVFVAFLSTMSDIAEGTFLSHSHYRGCFSALNDLRRQCEVLRDQAQFFNQAQTFTDLCEDPAGSKQKKMAKPPEGKEPMTFQLYRSLCMWFLASNSTEGIFAHTFLTLTWNLICSSADTCNTRKENISWGEDALLIRFAYHKKDHRQAGRIRHIYANPHMPEVCPIASLGRFLSFFPGPMTGPLFDGTSQYDRFRKILVTTLEAHQDQLLSMDIKPSEIGVHSIRKGAATYCDNGTIARVTLAAISSRAGWTLSGVKETSNFDEVAGDQHCGRFVVGLNATNHEFAVSPPIIVVDQVIDGLFNQNELRTSSPTSTPTETEVKTAIQTVFPGMGLKLGRLLLSSLLFPAHRKRIQGIKGTDHPLRSCIFMRREFIPLSLFTFIFFPHSNCEESTWRVKFTGIPPYVSAYCQQQQEVMLQMQHNKDRIIQEHNNIFRSQLNKSVPDPDELSAQRLRQIVVEPILESVNGLMLQMKKNASTVLPETKHDDTGDAGKVRDAKDCNSASTATKQHPHHPPRREMTFEWSDGVFRRLPESFAYPKQYTALEVWRCWHHGMQHQQGDNSHTTPPWKNLVLADFGLSRWTKEGEKRAEGEHGKIRYFYSMRFLCSALDKAAGIKDGTTPSMADLSTFFVSNEFKHLIVNDMTTEKGRKSRMTQLRWDTCSQKLRKLLANDNDKKRKKNQEVQPVVDKKQKMLNFDSSSAIVINDTESKGDDDDDKEIANI